MIKLYGIFHLPTGELIEITMGRKRLITATVTKHLQARLDKEIKSVIEYGNDEYHKHTEEYLHHCEVREIKYIMGAE